MRIKNFKNTTIERKLEVVPQLLKIPSKILNNEIDIERNITYNKIIDELSDLNYNKLRCELEYRLMDDENINDILLSIITRDSETKSTIGYHANILNYYLEQDLLNLFK